MIEFKTVLVKMGPLRIKLSTFRQDLSPVHLQHLLAVIREPTLPENVSLGILDGLVEELGLVQMQKFLQVTAPYRASWHVL